MEQAQEYPRNSGPYVENEVFNPIADAIRTAVKQLPPETALTALYLVAAETIFANFPEEDHEWIGMGAKHEVLGWIWGITESVKDDDGETHAA